MWIHITRWQIFDLGTLICLIVSTWRWWWSRKRWRWFRCRLSVLVGWRCTHYFTPRPGLHISCSAILARKGSIALVWMKHSQVSMYGSVHLSMPRKLNSPLRLFSDFSATRLDLILHFCYCGEQNISFRHFGHIQGKAHVGLFQLYPTTLPCHRSRHVENI